MKTQKYDVLIVGGGPAGLTAGLYASRGGLKTLLVEKKYPGGKVIITDMIENYPGFENGISGIELMGMLERQAKRFGLEIILGDISDIELAGLSKTVRVGDNKISCDALIIATGTEANKLNVEGEEKFIGRGVSFCATCDGAFYKGLSVAVIGGGDSAIQEALFLTKFAKRVYIVHRRDQLRAAKILQDRTFKNDKIKMVWDSVVVKIEGEKGVESVVVNNVKTNEVRKIDVDGVFVYVGIKPNTDFLKGIIDLDKAGFIITDENMQTSIPGVFAAGDVRAKLLKQIATAVGDGATAAFAIEKYIESMR